MNIQDAVTRAFHALATGMGPEAKEKIIDAVMSTEDNRNIIFALTGIAAGELSEAIDKLGIAEEEFKWQNKTQEERDAFLSRISPNLATKETLKHALDLIWLGACLGIAMESHKNQTDDAESMIREVLRDSDYGVGNCSLCFKRDYLKKWGPNGEPICAPCAQKHPDGILTIVNKKLREKFGDKAPQAISAGVISGKYSDIKDMTDDQIKAMYSQKEPDITKYN